MYSVKMSCNITDKVPDLGITYSFLPHRHLCDAECVCWVLLVCSMLSLGHMWDVCFSGGLMQYCMPYRPNDTQRYKQFLRVVWLDQALILLDLTIYLPNASVSSVFMVLYMFDFCCWILCFTFKCAEPGGIGRWHGWLAIVLQFCDTVGWVIWLMTSFPEWPIMYRVVR